jgi:hypothetical protein
MPKFEVHCQDCVRELGEPFEKVHQWLDELFAYCGADHRDIRHNNLGIEKVRQMWGDRAAEAARIHIVADEGCVPAVNEQLKLRLAIRKPHIYEAFRREFNL